MNTKQPENNFSVISVHGGKIDTRVVQLPQSKVQTNAESEVPEYFLVFLQSLLGDYSAKSIVDDLRVQARVSPQLTAALYQMDWVVAQKQLVLIDIKASHPMQVMQVIDALMLSYFDKEYTPKSTCFARRVVSPVKSEIFPVPVSLTPNESYKKMNMTNTAIEATVAATIEQRLQKNQDFLKLIGQYEDGSSPMDNTVLQFLVSVATHLKFDPPPMPVGELFQFMRVQLELNTVELNAQLVALKGVKPTLVPKVDVPIAINQEASEPIVFDVWASFSKAADAMAGNVSNVVELPKAFDSSYFDNKAKVGKKSMFSNPLMRNVSIGLGVAVLVGGGVYLYKTTSAQTLTNNDVGG